MKYGVSNVLKFSIWYFIKNILKYILFSKKVRSNVHHHEFRGFTLGDEVFCSSMKRKNWLILVSACITPPHLYAEQKEIVQTKALWKWHSILIFCNRKAKTKGEREKLKRKRGGKKGKEKTSISVIGNWKGRCTDIIFFGRW